MKNERILHADDTSIARRGFEVIFESIDSEDGHTLVGQASSVAEVKNLMRSGLRPTVAIIDHKMPEEGDGERTANIVREMSPDTIIISLSADEGVSWGDYNLTKNISGPELFRFLTNLQH